MIFDSRQRFFLFFITFLIGSATATAQKKLNIDVNAIKHWPVLNGDVQVTSDGQYFTYTVKSQHDDYQAMIFQAVGNTWKIEVPNASSATLSSDSKHAYFRLSDTLCFLTLGNNKFLKIGTIYSQKQPSCQKPIRIAFLFKEPDHQLVIYNQLSGKKECEFMNVQDYSFDWTGNHILIKLFETKAQEKFEKLINVNILDGTQNLVYSISNDNLVTTKIMSSSLDTKGTQVTFLLKKENEGKASYSIGYYKIGMQKHIIKADNNSMYLTKDLVVADKAPKFSNNGNYIIFSLQRQDTLGKILDGPQLDVWNYHDYRIQSFQQSDPERQTYVTVIGVNDSSRIIRIEKDHESVTSWSSKSDYLLLNKNIEGDCSWRDVWGTNYLVYLKDGSRTQLPNIFQGNIEFSPGGRYLVYFNPLKKGQYFSYELSTGKVSVLAKNANNSFSVVDPYQENDKGKIVKSSRAVGIGGWLTDDSAVIVYDNNDLWQLDISGKRAPINITKGYGAKHHVKFRITDESDVQNFYQKHVYQIGDSILLTSFNTKNKYNGFYRVTVGSFPTLKKLITGPWTFCHLGKEMLPNNSLELALNMKPLRAENANIWIVSRESAFEAPNYYSTSNFFNFNKLTDYHPQTSYNWVKSSVVSWKQIDGTMTQGILYAPESFNPQSKYPVIINFYEQLSHRAYEFPNPDYTYSAQINIPWFVSKGYLVLTPDIHYQTGNIGNSVLNTVLSACNWLNKLSYVERGRIGIAGHSFAGFETNYLITHTKKFAAAFEGAGSSDWISSALQLSPLHGDTHGELMGHSRLYDYEQFMGKSLWEAPEKYFKNSPVLNANCVTTPLLMFHCKNDSAVPWAQAIEMFIALRRLNKRVWMLQYDNGNHDVALPVDYKDLTIRVTQFFDHYLKGAPAPKWMTQGIPVSLKGKDLGYELDPTGKP